MNSKFHSDDPNSAKTLTSNTVVLRCRLCFVSILYCPSSCYFECHGVCHFLEGDTQSQTNMVSRDMSSEPCSFWQKSSALPARNKPVMLFQHVRPSFFSDFLVSARSSLRHPAFRPRFSIPRPLQHRSGTSKPPASTVHHDDCHGSERFFSGSSSKVRLLVFLWAAGSVTEHAVSVILQRWISDIQPCAFSRRPWLVAKWLCKRWCW